MGPLDGRVALVAGGTRGARRGIAVELGAAGATVDVTGRTSGIERSELDRPETIEETAALVDAADGRGTPVNGQSLSSGALAEVYGFTDVDGSQPDAWRYLVEVQDAGKPADVTGYR
jgi:NAD(P)-dependent dehydrogenase (short-subunit alcohol dehydrogenase family)